MRSACVTVPSALACTGASARKIPSYPVQNYLTRPIRNASRAKGDPDYMSLWAGQGSPMMRSCGAGDLVRMLVEEYLETMGHLSGKI